MSRFLQVLILQLLLSSLLSDNLICFFSPLLDVSRGFELMLTECPPDELCYVADGHYGNYTALSARGCTARKRCSRVRRRRYRGTVYNLSYSCCDEFYCNSCRRMETPYITLLVLTASSITLQ